jgi:hypothetical protein
MTAAHLRDAAATAAILGFFASSWFGWAQERPPGGWRRPLTLAAVGSLALAAAGAVLAWRHRADGSVFDQDGTARSFGIVVGVEVALAGIGALVLARTGRAQLTAPWVALVVGLHLVPLAPLLEYPLLYLTAAGVVAAAVAAVPLAARRRLAPSAPTGVGAGSVLAATALVSLATVLS